MSVHRASVNSKARILSKSEPTTAAATTVHLQSCMHVCIYVHLLQPLVEGICSVNRMLSLAPGKMQQTRHHHHYPHLYDYHQIRCFLSLFHFHFRFLYRPMSPLSLLFCLLRSLVRHNACCKFRKRRPYESHLPIGSNASISI